MDLYLPMRVWSWYRVVFVGSCSVPCEAKFTLNEMVDRKHVTTEYNKMRRRGARYVSCVL